MRYFLDLFAGIGGFALGAEWAGVHFDGHYFSEIDEYAIKVYTKRFPDAIPLGDICKISGRDLPDGEWIIAGGFPCQDISVAGKGAGLDGARSGLWFEYARIIGELRPGFAIMENVGALTHRGLDRVLGSLAEIGYDAEWQDIRASDVGAPHRRERIWIVAYAASTDEQTCKSTRGREQVQSGRSGRGENVAYPDTTRGLQPQRLEQEQWGRVSDGGQAMADSNKTRSQGQCESSGATQEYARSWGGYECTRQQWTVEPDVGRVAHGIPTRVDRLKCLGNSIVPQIAMLIFQEIKAYL